MTLEDFFTLTEMKDGLTAPARVKELVTVMHKEKDCVVKNASDMTRQWSTVASTIAATENKDCLDLFIQLDGLWFIDRWLKDAQKFGNDTGNSFVEESLTALLRALENLHIDNQKSVSSGIWMTVKNLLGHSSSRVQDRARVLFDSWKQDRDCDAGPQDIEKVEAFSGDGLKVRANHVEGSGRPECSSQDITPSRGSNEEKNVDPARDETMPSICSDAIQPEKFDNVQIQTSEKTPDSVNDIHPIKEDPLAHCLVGTTVIGTYGSAVQRQGTLEGKLDVAELNQCTDDAKQMLKISSSEKLNVMNVSSVSSPFEHRAPSSSADATNASESATDPDSKEDVDAKDKYPFADVRTVVTEGKSGRDDGESSNLCRITLEFKTTNQDGECNADVLQDSSRNNVKLSESEDPNTYFSRIGDIGVVDEATEHASDESEDDSGNDSGNDSDFFKPAVDTKRRDVIYKSSDIELDYGIVDPLEVARQVAMEVEREVDCREPSCSSSDKIAGGGIRQPDSPDSTNGKQSQPIGGARKDVPTGSNLSTDALPKGEVFIKEETLGGERENCIHDMESSPVTEAAQEPEAKAEKGGFCGFDLNEEVCAEDTDMDHSVNPISTPISVVSASRAAAATGLPVSPLQFEGTLGWKGPAATSAFRPASPRRTIEGDKTLFTLGNGNSSKQRQAFLDFDLNVAEGGEDKTTDLMAGKKILITSGESSVEASSIRSERLHWDLNRVNDGGDVPSDWRREGRLLPHRNGLHSPSPSSSSSSMQPSLRNIDLNDQPSFFGDSLDHPYFGKSSQNLNASGGIKADDSVISIMGARVEVNRKDFVPQTVSLPNGRTSESAVDLNLARTGAILGIGSPLPYTHSPIYGYNGLTSGPTVPFTSTMYGHGGPIPYMVDSRGVHVVPQIMGSSSTLPHSFSQPPFIMSMTGPPSVSNGVGPSRHNFDLNSGLIMEGGNRDSGGLRQLFNPGQGRSIDEHLRANAQPPSSSTGVGERRKEPDSGWEPYPFNYKHHQPPWK